MGMGAKRKLTRRRNGGNGNRPGGEAPGTVNEIRFFHLVYD